MLLPPYCQEPLILRRADRLFRMVNLMQRKRGPITAKAIAEELEVSVRTVYRDVADLMASGVPLEGEAGIGYQMAPDFTLPPMMLNDAEVEAAVFGLAVAEEWGDPAMAIAARSLRDKINASLPQRLREVLAHTRIVAPADKRVPPIAVDQADIRRCIRSRNVIEIQYTDMNGTASKRSVWPLGLVFFGKVWMLACWCENKNDNRFFRLDRIKQLQPLQRRFPLREGQKFENLMDKQWSDGNS